MNVCLGGYRSQVYRQAEKIGTRTTANAARSERNANKTKTLRGFRGFSRGSRSNVFLLTLSKSALLLGRAVWGAGWPFYGWRKDI